jgi:hypothetical protein
MRAWSNGGHEQERVVMPKEEVVVKTICGRKVEFVLDGDQDRYPVVAYIGDLPIVRGQTLAEAAEAAAEILRG